MDSAQSLASRAETEPPGTVVVTRDHRHLGPGGANGVETPVEQAHGILGRQRTVVDVTGHHHQVDPLFGDKTGQPTEKGLLVILERLAFESATDVPVAGVNDPHGPVSCTRTDCQTGVPVGSAVPDFA
jgi:hypothetical protein